MHPPRARRLGTLAGALTLALWLVPRPGAAQTAPESDAVHVVETVTPDGIPVRESWGAAGAIRFAGGRLSFECITDGSESVERRCRAILENDGRAPVVAFDLECFTEWPRADPSGPPGPARAGVETRESRVLVWYNEINTGFHASLHDARTGERIGRALHVSCGSSACDPVCFASRGLEYTDCVTALPRLPSVPDDEHLPARYRNLGGAMLYAFDHSDRPLRRLAWDLLTRAPPR